MRSYRVFNDVSKVRVVWKLAGIRLGGFSQIVMLSLMAICTLLIQLVGLIPAAVVFVAGFMAIAVYSSTLTRLDPSGALSEITALRLLGRGLKHRHSANFDLPGL
jgi:hypothetical protein